MSALGAVNERREAVVRLRLRGPDGGEADVDAVVDTGYTGTLALPASECMALGLPLKAGVTTVLADGSSRRVHSYAAEVRWGAEWRAIAASAVGADALIGMALLEGHRLEIDVTAGGAVSVRPMPTQQANA